MSLKAGIVGLPNVGKSTLFNAITNSHVEAANYPFATINPNTGVVNVPDERLDFLSNLFKPERTIPATVEFYDIAGLVKGASKGEGLGNQFLGNIRNCNAIIEVVRCFDDDNIIHVEGNVNPIRDIETIELELILADLDSIQKRIVKIEKKAQSKVDDAEAEFKVLKKIESALLEETSVRDIKFEDEELKYVTEYQLLTYKPLMLVCNIKEDDIATPENSKHYNTVLEYAKKKGLMCVPISAQIESELATLEDDDKALFLEEYGLKEAGLNLLIRKTYALLGYKTFFTVGPDECRAWTFKDGMYAPECAGIIHSDFQRGFIRAETTAYDDLISSGSMLKAREKGLVRQEGKEYKVKDGDILLFKFNV